MFPMRRVLAKNFKAKCAAFFLVAFSLVPAQTALPVADSIAAPVTDSVAVSVEDSAAAPAADSVPVVVADSTLSLLGSLQTAPDSAMEKPVASKSETPAPDTLRKPLKSVLYLSGGEHSVWFHLGVLYAIESYSIPVDSVVGTSWGALVGYLWAKGMPLDDIQRILLNPYVADFVGHNEFENLYAPKEVPRGLPVSLDGFPSVRQRFTLSADSNGSLHRHSKSLDVDSAWVKSRLARLYLQQFIYGEPRGTAIPFAVSGADGKLEQGPESVFKTLPFLENENSGELDPYVAVPLEDNIEELAVISVAVPHSNANYNPEVSPWQRHLSERELDNLSTQPGVVIQAHTILDTLYTSWIQAGFSSFERRLGELSPIRSRSVNYAAQKKTVSTLPKVNPVYDSVSAEFQAPMKTYWNDSDSGMVAAGNFATALLSQPAYDSVKFEMLPNGETVVSAAVKPTFDVFAGGFGSNAIGPNVYAGVSLAYVDQMEFNMTLPGFWGGESYGFMPELQVSHLWNKSWSFLVGYDYMVLRPLKSFANETPESERIFSEKRNDLKLSVGYRLDELQQLSLNFLFGNRTFELSKKYYEKHDFETFPVSPSLSYELASGEKDRWFSAEGYSLTASAAMQSIGFEFGLSNVIPIYWMVSADARYSMSPTDFFTVTVGASAGIDFYHEEGYGYVYPESFDYQVLDNCFRQHVKATPWSTEWYNPDLSSHNYALFRANAGLHYGWVGAWLFGAYVLDFEENSTAVLDKNKIVVEPALRLGYKSISIYAGLSRIVDSHTMDDLKDFKDYQYFIRIGNYDLF